MSLDNLTLAKVKSLSLELMKYSQDTDMYATILKDIAFLTTKTHKEILFQLVRKGPVWDGDVISKSRRDDLINWGFASKGYYKGEQGYTYANYRGGNLLKVMQENETQN